MCKYHMYADDTQIYYSFDPDQIDARNAEINDDFRMVYDKTLTHVLTINATKAAVIVFGRPKACQNIFGEINLTVNGQKMDVVEVVKNLGLTIDCDLRFRQRVARLTGASFGKLKVLYGSRDSLTAELRKTCESLSV